MTQLLEPTSFPAPAAGEAPSEAVLRTPVGALLRDLLPEGARDNRMEKRVAFPHLVYLTPVAEDGLTPIAGTLVAAGKHLSKSGLGFCHPDPLPYRLVIVSFERAPGQWLSFLLELRWCRFVRSRWYESGGRFLRVAPTPVAEFVSMRESRP